jgi:hypothetical protein
MTDHTLMVLFALAFIVMFFAFLTALSERNHWRAQYKRLANSVLYEGYAETRKVLANLDALNAQVVRTWDEIVDELR